MLATSHAFKENAHAALRNERLQRSLARSKSSFQARRAAAVMNLPEFEQLRDEGRAIKDHTLANLDFYLEQFAAYTTFSTGGRRPGDLDGPEEYHVVLIDNGRSARIWRSGPGSPGVRPPTAP